MFRAVSVRDDEITSEAELAFNYGDQAEYERAALEAGQGASERDPDA